MRAPSWSTALSENASADSDPLIKEGRSNPFSVEDDALTARRPNLADQDAQALELRPALTGASGSSTAVPLSHEPGTLDNESLWQKQTASEIKASGQSQLNENAAVALRGISQPWSDRSLNPAYKTVNDSIVNEGRFGQGEDYYERMIALDINTLGPHHPSVANDLNGLARFYIRQKDYARAEPILLRAYAIYKETYGLDNLLTINCGAAYALVEFRLGKLDKAEELYRTVLTHSQSALGAGDFQTARILNELAYLYFYQGKLEEASSLYKSALASTESAVGEHSPLLSACMQDYAKVLRRLGQTAEADELERRANSILIGER